MNKLKLSLACGSYDRVAPLFSGAVQIDGVELTPLPIAIPTEIFGRMISRQEFDIAEMSLTHCFALAAAGRAPFVTLPVFPSRLFRHGFIFVNQRSGIRAPGDLSGKRIGVQGYQMTAAVWIRGILQDEYGVSLESVHWVEGGVNEPATVGTDVTRLRPACAVDITDAPSGRTLSECLASGEIDALIGATAPSSLRASPDVVRLIPDYHAVERDYYKRTGIFPIMHALVIRNELHRAHPWLASSVYKAFQASKKLALAQMRVTAASRYMLPWLFDHIEEMDEVFGANFWPYGLAANRATLETFSRYLAEQHLTAQLVPPEQVFVAVEEAA